MSVKNIQLFSTKYLFQKQKHLLAQLFHLFHENISLIPKDNHVLGKQTGIFPNYFTIFDITIYKFVLKP
jgi:hypothetical protein